MLNEKQKAPKKCEKLTKGWQPEHQESDWSITHPLRLPWDEGQYEGLAGDMKETN